MVRPGFYFDMRRCIACRACQAACKDKNDLPAGSFLRRAGTYEMYEDGQPRLVNYSGACNHCENPLCETVCPAGATKRLEDGTVACDSGKCIGCGSCVWSCPYGAPLLSKDSGTAQKCDLCADLRASGGNPACVDACPVHCLEFGDMDELREKHGHGLVRSIPILPDEELTCPSLLIRRT